MKRINHIQNKKTCLAIGLMSGTSLDGIDAALVEITGFGAQTQVKLRAFTTTPFTLAFREKLLTLVLGKTGGTYDVCQANALIGKLSAKACLDVCAVAQINPKEVDFVGSHGQTVYHQPEQKAFAGEMTRGTLQIWEAAEIAEAMGCVVVADFRVRDMAAGGQGAPLVPYTEYLLYQEKTTCVALQNMGGIGNITILPPGGTLNDVIAFDTGPGNMLIDGAITAITHGEKTFDNGGEIGGRGTVNEKLARYLIKKDENYLNLAPPKSTGREYYNAAYMDGLMAKKREWLISDEDFIATITYHSAACIAYGIKAFAPVKPQKLIIGGGGSHNQTLVKMIAQVLPECQVLTQEEVGLHSDGKEAIAFAILANETLRGNTNNAPSATGAAHPVVMGKITL